MKLVAHYISAKLDTRSSNFASTKPSSPDRPHQRTTLLAPIYAIVFKWPVNMSNVEDISSTNADRGTPRAQPKSRQASSDSLRASKPPCTKESEQLTFDDLEVSTPSSPSTVLGDSDLDTAESVSGLPASPSLGSSSLAAAGEARGSSVTPIPGTSSREISGPSSSHTAAVSSQGVASRTQPTDSRPSVTANNSQIRVEYVSTILHVPKLIS